MLQKGTKPSCAIPPEKVTACPSAMPTSKALSGISFIIMFMVKAFAYGAGSYEVAKTLQDHRVDYLAVAVADEGSDLRKAGITGSIMKNRSTRCHWAS